MLGASYSILLVEDNPGDVLILRRMLGADHELSVAPNASLARTQIEKTDFQCILVDYNLPDVEGWAFVDELVQLGVPVIVLTGYETDDFGIAALKHGAEDYLTKDELNSDLLRRALRYAVERARARARMHEAEQERKELEKQFHQSQKMEAIGRLAGGVAHDFNNLLTAIIGFSRFVLDELAPGDHRREDLIHVLKAADRAETLTRQLLAFSRKQTIEPRVLSLNELINNVERLIHRTIGEHIEIRLQLEPELAAVKVDAAQFEQVLMNMAVNARDAMPGGGTLEIATRNDIEHRRVRVLISDSGLGMSKEVQHRIFEPFFTTKDRNSGTGLGLATCYGIIKQSGGEIEVESEVGAGTCFTIELPIADGEAVPLAELRPDPSTGGIEGRGRILVVEDDERVRALAVRMLQKNGYTTVEAATTREGRDVFDIEDGQIDALVSDIVMPDGRGTELAAQLCARDPNLRVLLMTGYDDDALDSEILDRIYHRDLIRKPFVEGALVRKVRDLLGAPDIEVDPLSSQLESPRSDRPRVLLVDDDAGTRRTYQRLLGDEFDVQVLDDSPEDVLERLKREPFDIIFFDVIMPRVSGFDLAEQAMAVAPDNAKRIVHLTGMQDDMLVDAYAKQMNQRIVCKPLTVEKLEEILKERQPTQSPALATL